MTARSVGEKGGAAASEVGSSQAMFSDAYSSCLELQHVLHRRIPPGRREAIRSDQATTSTPPRRVLVAQPVCGALQAA